jgi:hypothetical protein
MQQSSTMPSNLKKYQDSGAYVPQHAQAAMAEHLQKSLPGHLKQYAGAYMEQRVIQPHANTAAMPGSAPGLSSGLGFTPHAPVPNSTPQSHFQPTEGLPVEQPAVLAPAPPSDQPVSPEHAYDFITNAGEPVKKRSLPGGNSLPIRILTILGGLLVLIIIVAVLKSVLGGSSNLPSFVAVAQDQQELIHLTAPATGTGAPASLSVTNQNFAATAGLSLTSSQAGLLGYLKSIGTKSISPKVLNLKVSSTIDTELTAAATADTYDQTFQQVMQNSLKQYRADLAQAYQKTSGVRGHALLKSDYNQAGLLLTQLGAPAG